MPTASRPGGSDRDVSMVRKVLVGEVLVRRVLLREVSVREALIAEETGGAS